MYNVCITLTCITWILSFYDITFFRLNYNVPTWPWCHTCMFVIIVLLFIWHRLGGQDRQSRPCFLCGPCEPHHHVAEAEPRGQEQRHSEIQLHTPDGAAQQEVWRDPDTHSYKLIYTLLKILCLLPWLLDMGFECMKFQPYFVNCISFC